MREAAPALPGPTEAFEAGREAHIVYAFLRGGEGPDEGAPVFRALSGEERERAATFRSKMAKRQFLCGRLLARQCLGIYLGRAPETIGIEADVEGKLFVAGERGLDFNISHKPGCVAVGFSRGGAIGVDVEVWAPERANEKIGRRFFAPDEVAQLEGLAAETLAWRFYRFWTLKEAYIKARGLGLKLPLSDFSFSFKDAEVLEQTGEGIRIAFRGRIEDRPERWQFQTTRIARDHLLSVAVERRGGAALALRYAEMDLPA